MCKVCVCVCGLYSNDELTKRFEELDKDGNGVLSENEVVSVIGEMMCSSNSSSCCRRCCCSSIPVDRRDDGSGSAARAGADADVWS